MQFLLISRDDTMVSISKIVGQQNIDKLLAENNLIRMPRIGEQWYQKCEGIIRTTDRDVEPSRKMSLLNSLVDSMEAFEKASLMDEDEWKVFSQLIAFKDALRIPESLEVPYSTRVIGAAIGNVTTANIGNIRKYGSSPKTFSSSQEDFTYQAYQKPVVGVARPSVEPVNAVTYKAVMEELKLMGRIDPGLFNSINTAPSFKLDNVVSGAKEAQYAYNLPWGKIQLYSNLLDEMIDFPAYPDPLSTSRSANYTAMPDLLNQYEPWIIYDSSGPREQSLQFHLHRDMWSGDHRDGKANELIRFCEANTFPRYNGSTVLAPTVRLYIDGSLFIGGVLTNTETSWDGPLGLDNWYLEFTISLTIQEVSDVPLNIDTVRNFGIKGI